MELTRRSFMAAGGAVFTTGCIHGDGGEDVTENVTEDDGGSDDERIEADAVDWSEVEEFRKWLTDVRIHEEDNLRFDYTDGYEETYVAGGRVEFLDIPPEDFTGHLARGGNIVHFGEFGDTVVERAEESGEHERVETYHGFEVFEAENTEVAIGDDAVVVGSGRSKYRELIDARHGDRERLEEVDSDFTLMFQRLPDGESIVGQYGTPAGGDVDVEDIYLWGSSMETPQGGETTWVFVFEDEEDLTEDVLEELEEINPGGGVSESEVDGRVATVVGDVEPPS